MSKKVEPTEYLDEDYLFLVLKLLDYPRIERDELTFNEIKAEKYKHATASKIFCNVADFNKQDVLKIEELRFNILDFKKNGYKDIKTMIRAMIRYPKQELSLAVKRIINNNFNLYDLEIVLSYERRDIIFDLIDFDIKINKKFKQIFIKDLQKYLKLFTNGGLESPTKNYLKIELQKKGFKARINEISKKTGSMLVLKDFYFGDKYRFFENILLLEKERFLIIKNISSEKTAKDLSSYIIHCELKNENNFCAPFCIIKKDMGFLKFSKNGETIKIGREDSQHFKLLKFLLESFGMKERIDYAFGEIETKRVKKYPDLDPSDQMRKLEYVVKELQKRNRLRGRLKITIDKDLNQIWIELMKRT